MPTRSSKHVDINQLAKRILDEAIDDKPKTEPPPVKNQSAVELGRLGGKKGGNARAAKLPPERRSEIAKKAANDRWTKQEASIQQQDAKVSSEVPKNPPTEKRRIVF